MAFAFASRPPVATPPRTAPGERIYAIGDVHGRYDLLCELLRSIEAHSNARPDVPSVHIVLLGDLVDRGPASSDVVRLAHGADGEGQVITLLGNHEDLMLRALDGEASAARTWLGVGGRATLRSFGIEPPERGGDPSTAIARARETIPRDLVAWLRKRPLSAKSGDYFFCHAGIRPGASLKRQNRADLLWIRDEFLEDDGDHGVVVVHGHSVANEVEMRANRIGIDTGAYRTGLLSALYLEGEEREVLSVRSETATTAG